jgi:hypothetical protein
MINDWTIKQILNIPHLKSTRSDFYMHLSFNRHNLLEHVVDLGHREFTSPNFY